MLVLWSLYSLRCLLSLLWILLFTGVYYKHHIEQTKAEKGRSVRARPQYSEASWEHLGGAGWRGSRPLPIWQRCCSLGLKSLINHLLQRVWSQWIFKERAKRGEMTRRASMTIQPIKSRFQHRTPLFKSRTGAGLCLEAHLSSVWFQSLKIGDHSGFGYADPSILKTLFRGAYLPSKWGCLLMF